MRALLLSACLLATPLTAQETPPGAPGTPGTPAGDISGRYLVEGRNPDGSAYSGSMEMSRDGGLYRITWTIAGQIYSGEGRLDGRVLTVDWQGDTEPVVYVVMPDGDLHGTWADGRALDRLAPVN